MAALKDHGIETIDLLAVNLYPFEATVAKPGCTLEDAIENIDIGGPAMVRSAAKNWKHVGVLTDASQYSSVLDELKLAGKLSDRTRFALSVAAFNRISNYDAAISDYLSSIQEGGTRALFPSQANGRFVKLQDLRYGENPHQQAAFYRDLYPAPGSLVTARQLQGKELSYNNIVDADAAWECVKSFDGPRASSSSTPTRVASQGRIRWRPTARRSKPIPPRPSAASSLSTARWTARRLKPFPNSSSRC
jgi:phosphoribosylaminoimidazolecarboxamide formyltransferase/IMP cyclohydrolase